MRQRGYFSLRWKLLALLLTLSLAFWSLLSILHLRDQRRLIDQNLRDTIALRKSTLAEGARTLSSNLRRQAENEIASYNLSGLSETLKEAVDHNEDLAYAILMDADGIIRLHTARPETVNEPAGSEADRFAATRQTPTIREYGKGASALLEHIEPIRFGGRHWGSLRLGYSMEALADDIANAEHQMRDEENRLFRRFAVASAVILAASALFLVFVSRRFIRPIAQLTRAADQLAMGDFTAAHALPYGENDELGLLSRAFSDMARNLESSQLKLKQLVETAQRAETFLNSIVENIPHMIFVKDARTLRFVRFNRAGERLLGYSRHEMIGRGDGDFFDPLMAHAFMEKDRKVIESGVPLDIPEEPIVVRDGSIRLLHTRKIPIRGSDGQPLYLLGISEDITESKKLADDHRRLQEEVLNIATAEQERIAHDLHDGLGQILTGLAYKAKLVERVVGDGEAPSCEDARRIVELANQASEQARALARGLDPVVLRDGLLPALHDLAHSMREIFGVQTILRVNRERIPLDKRCALHLYRIAQESVTNAIRHGRAKRIEIGLVATDQHLLLTIVDDGIGLHPHEAISIGAGIRNMHYRARSIGGELNVSGRSAGGVLVACTLPYQLIDHHGGSS